MKALTDRQDEALRTISTPAYTADGTVIDERTGKALWRRRLVRWSDAEQRYRLTDRGAAYMCEYGII